MSAEHWTQEQAGTLARLRDLAREQWTAARRLRRHSGFIVCVSAWAGVFQTWTGYHLSAVVMLLAMWLQYRMHRRAQRRECLWRTCWHHCQRLAVEEPARLAWHFMQLCEAYETLETEYTRVL